MELVKILERSNNIPSRITLRDGNRTVMYYSVPKVARLMGVQYKTVHSWIRRGFLYNFVRDPLNGRIYAPESEVTKLKQRFAPLKLK